MRTRTTRIIGSGVGLLAAGALGLGIGLSTSAGAATDGSTDGSTDSATSAATAPGECDGSGGPGVHPHTEVPEDQLTAVADAVTAHDAALTIETVRQDPDGSFDVLATDADGNRVMVEVSADLATIEVRAGGPGPRGEGRGPGHGEGQGRHGHRGGADQQPSDGGAGTESGTSGASASSTTAA